MAATIDTHEVRALTTPDWTAIDPHLREFADALAEVMPTIEFYGYRHYRLYVAHKGDPFTVGSIAYEDYRANVGWGDAPDQKYGVFSNNITNHKYADCNEYYRLKASKSMAVAIRNAKAALRRPSNQEVATRVFTSALQPVRNHYHERLGEFVSAVRENLVGGAYTSVSPKTLRNAPYIRELLTVNERGDITDPEFASELTKIVSMEKELLSMVADDAEWHIVVVRNNARNEPRVVTVKMLVSGAPNEWGNSFKISDEAYVMEPQEVPEDIQGKTSVLNMVDYGHYVEGVGVRMADGCYYINTDEAPKL